MSSPISAVAAESVAHRLGFQVMGDLRSACTRQAAARVGL